MLSRLTFKTKQKYDFRYCLVLFCDLESGSRSPIPVRMKQNLKKLTHTASMEMSALSMVPSGRGMCELFYLNIMFMTMSVCETKV